MAERFAQLYKLPGNLYVAGAPIIIAAGTLLLDTETENIVAQLKFHSVSDKQIKAIKVSLAAYDISEAMLTGIDNYQYLDLSVRQGQYFGSNKAIVFPSAITRSFSFKSISVVFGDKTSWEWDAAEGLEALPLPTPLYSVLKNRDVEQQYRLVTNKQAANVPVVHKDLWLCSCGEANKGNACTKCCLEKELAFRAFNIDVLSKQANDRLLIEQAEREEYENKEKQSIQATNRRKNILLNILGALMTFWGVLFCIASISNLLSDGFTIRVICLLLWTFSFLAAGILLLVGVKKRNNEGLIKRIKSAGCYLTVVGIITFIIFFVLTYC